VKPRFFIDPETGTPHIHNHAVDENEVEEVLGNSGEDVSAVKVSEQRSAEPETGAISESSMCSIRHHSL
jgi:hypothetical protein